ncbi:TasA family protein [Haloterrigena salinisoli]|uniref:TasA family protein n=1 Tax=Haloterrigena salinisoli TaxID=3132747 RepID=UPI0030CCC94B
MDDSESQLELTRRRFFEGLSAVGLAAGGVGAGTWAYFSDSETSARNEVTAGTLDLGITNGGSIEWLIQGGAPGGSNAWDDQDVQLFNSGTVDGSHVKLDFENNTYEDDNGDRDDGTSSGPESDPTDGADGMTEYVKVEKLGYDDTDGNTVLTLVNDGESVSNSDHPDIRDTNGNGYIDLDDLAAAENEDALDDLTPVPPKGGSADDKDTQTTVTIEVALAAEIPNDYQGDVVKTNVTFSLRQGSS